MAANPPLCQDPYYGHTFPLPYHGEQICLSRGCIDIKLEGGALRTRGNKCVAGFAEAWGCLVCRWRLHCVAE